MKIADVNLLFTVDQSKSPWQIDLTFLDGPHKGKILRGIYKFNPKGVLQISFADPETRSDRPADVSYETGAGRTMINLKRIADSNGAEKKIGAMPKAGGVWNKPLAHFARSTRPDPWFSVMNLGDLNEDPWVNPVKIGLVADAPIEQIAEKTAKGDIYVAEPDLLQAFHGTQMAPLGIRSSAIGDQQVLIKAVNGMTCQQIADQIAEFIKKTPDLKQHRIKESDSFAVLRPDGRLFVMGVFGPPKELGVQIIPIGWAHPQDVGTHKPIAKDLQPFQGTWSFGACESVLWYADLEEIRKTWSWTIQDHEITWTRQGKEAQTLSFTVDPSKSPPQIDFQFLDGPNKGEKCRGIYKFEKGSLWVCMTEPGADVGIDATFRQGPEP